MIDKHLWQKPLFIFIVLAFLTGCNTLRPDPNPLLDNKALEFTSKAKSYNQHIVASKGTGWINLKAGNRTDRFKIVWATAFPNKIRITFLLSGHPIGTIIATGQKVMFISHTGEHSPYITNSDDPDLKTYIKIPVKLSELILVLLGRFPIKTFEDVYFSPKDPSLSTIILWKDWQGICQYLNVDGQGRLNSIKTTDSKGQVLYDLSIIDYKTYSTDSIASTVHLIDTQGRTMTLRITSFIINPVIKESVFRLTAKGS
ncbi:MAG: hypothetical protein L3J69_13865 [Desulfobacula sp.]|nr:hypothetical protein [Desulfobacula sp.]